MQVSSEATRAAAEGHPFDIRNGWQALQSPELTLAVPGRTAHTQIFDGRMVGQYPFLFPLLAAGPYLLWGFHGLVVSNLVAAAMACAIVAHLALRLTGKPSAAWASALLLCVTGFWLEYAYGAWPHVTAAAFWLVGMALIWTAEDAVDFHGAADDAAG